MPIRQVTQHFYDVFMLKEISTQTQTHTLRVCIFLQRYWTSEEKEACNWNNILKITPYRLRTLMVFYKVTKV